MHVIIEFLSACLTLSRDRTNRQSLNLTCTETFNYLIFGPESWLHLSSSHQLCRTKAVSTLQQTRWSCKKRNVQASFQQSEISDLNPSWLTEASHCGVSLEMLHNDFTLCGSFCRMPCCVGSRRSKSSKWECFCLIKCRPCGKIMNQCL